MRIKIVILAGRRDDALVFLDSVGFVREDPDGLDDGPKTDGQESVIVTGELPENAIGELALIDGVLDWSVPPLEEAATSGRVWPWSQNPETD